MQNPKSDYTPVSVIASFDTKGNVIPLYIRIDDDTIQVTSCTISEQFFDSTVYSIKAEDHGYMRDIFLLFSKRNSTWKLDLEYKYRPITSR